ncbi:MAG: arsenosugar biosynthesis radical SAM protein ArsS [Acidobacteriota bacterium]|nr:arsenosugar biosynthesis radical SAM protein ArsS [Acidobacteriota bacterium]
MTVPAFSSKLQKPLTTYGVNCLQVNLGKLCNQACKHCHVDAGPKRTEIMDRETVQHIIAAAEMVRPELVDLTGGAPEMNPHFRELVEALRDLGVPRIMDRCNLTILLEPGFDWVANFLAKHRIEVTASLPFYVGEHVDRQRGKGVFSRSIEGLRILNGLGYGDSLPLNLVYNPQGAYLPPDQDDLEQLYKRHLAEEYGIRFNELYTITNMPIARFKTYLERSENYTRYMNKLVSRFNPGTLDGLMCRSLISVGYDGRLYDCDFNQMLDMTIDAEQPHISQLRDIMLTGRPIRTDDHCYGCTAGHGSSCGGALDTEDEAIAV